jgi:hypothetical protein
MGSRARQRAALRTAQKQSRREIDASRQAAMATPEFAAMMAAAVDDEVVRLAQADEPAQVARLTAAGFRLREAGTEGAGIWNHRRGVRIMHSIAREADGQAWAHVSVSHKSGALPGWYEVRDAQQLLYPDRPGVVVVAAAGEHVDLAEVAHVWTCLTARTVPDFRKMGQI